MSNNLNIDTDRYWHLPHAAFEATERQKLNAIDVSLEYKYLLTQTRRCLTKHERQQENED
jgi:alpha-D-ribose 1-methylphosphonate 5-triphosphate synthase subunit PhnL